MANIIYDGGIGSIISDITVTGSLTFTTAGTYTILDSTINEVINTSLGTVTIQLAGTTTITNNSGPLITINAPQATFDFTGLVAGSQVIVFETGTTTEVHRNDTSGTTDSSPNIDAGSYDYTIMKAGHFPLRVVNVSAVFGSNPVPVSQVLDRAYEVSSGLTYGSTATINTGTNEFAVTVATTVQNFYSFWIEQWISNVALANLPFHIEPFGEASFSLIHDYEFTAGSIPLLSRDGFRYVSSGDVVTAKYCAVLSQGVSAGLQAEYITAPDGTATYSANTGNVDQVIQFFGDITHGNFDASSYLTLKVQANGYRQAETSITDTYGTLVESLYVASLITTDISGLTLGDPAITGITMTDNSAAPASWDAGDGFKNYSITITDTGANSPDDILRWLNYNLSLDASFQGKEPFYWPEMILVSGTNYETIRGNLYKTGGAVVAGVRIIDGSGNPRQGFSRFQADNGTYGTPPLTTTLTINNLDNATVHIVEDDGVTVYDSQPSQTGTYATILPFGSSGTWSYVVNRVGYAPVIGSFDVALGSLSVNGTLVQKLLPDGSSMYGSGTGSALLSVIPQADGLSMLCRIGNGSVSAQVLFDETEAALMTSDGLTYLTNGGGEISIALLPTGIFVFLETNVRLIRNTAPDDNATLNAFAQSTDNVVVDGTNGPVQFVAVTESAKLVEYSDKIVISSTGTDSGGYPYGTPLNPCKTLQNCIDLKAAFGINNIDIKGSLALDVDIDGFNFFGNNEDTFDINNKSMLRCFFNQVRIRGIDTDVTTEARFNECLIDANLSVRGYFDRCIFGVDATTVTLIGGGSNFIHCSSSVAGIGSVHIANPTGYDFTVRAWLGGLRIKNMPSGKMSFGSPEGRLTVDSTVVSPAEIVVRGVSSITNESLLTINSADKGYTLDDSDLIAVAVHDGTLADHADPLTMGGQLTRLAYSGAEGQGVHVSDTGTAGQVPGVNGTSANPCSSLTDALVIADIFDLNTVYVHGTITADRSLNNATYHKYTPTATVDLNGKALDTSNFQKLSIIGASSGTATFKDCRLVSMSGYSATIIDGSISGICTIPDSGVFAMRGTGFENSATVVHGTSTVLWANLLSGDLQVNNSTATCFTSLAWTNGSLVIDTSCTDAFLFKVSRLFASDITNNSGLTIALDTTYPASLDMSTSETNIIAEVNANEVKIDALSLASVPTEYVPTSATRVLGDDDGNTYTVLAVTDGTFMTTGETATGLEVEVAISATDILLKPTHVSIVGFYNSNTASHRVDVFAYNYVTLAWDMKTVLEDRIGIASYSVPLNTDNQHASTGEMKLRFLHNVVGGYNTNHYLSLDSVTWSKIATNVELAQNISQLLANQQVMSVDVESILEDTNSTIPTQISGLNNISAADVWASVTRTLTDKTGFELTSGERALIATAVEQSILNEGDGEQVLNAIVGAIGNTNVDEVALVAAIRVDLERASGTLDNIDSKTTNIPVDPASSTEIGSAFTEIKGAGWTTETLKDIRDNSGGLDESALHTALDSYTNKDDWKASNVDLSSIITAIDALNDLSTADIDARLASYGAPTLTEMTAAFTEIKGPTWTTSDSLEAIVVAIGTGGITVADVWDYTTRELTAGTKDTEIDAIKASTDNLPSDPASESSISSLNDFNPATDAVANVTLVDTTTTNTDMRGTDSANTVAPDNTSIAAILADTDDLQTNQGNFTTATGFSTTADVTTAKNDIITQVDANEAKIDALETKAQADVRQDSLIIEHDATQTTLAGLNNVSATDVWAAATRSLTDKSGFELTSAERTAISVAVESAILNEGDGQTVLNAIVSLINTNLDLSTIELQAIATQVRTELSTELARIDANVTSRSIPGDVPSTVEIATAVVEKVIVNQDNPAGSLGEVIENIPKQIAIKDTL
jgi:hypothetical protein